MDQKQMSKLCEIVGVTELPAEAVIRLRAIENDPKVDLPMRATETAKALWDTPEVRAELLRAWPKPHTDEATFAKFMPFAAAVARVFDADEGSVLNRLRRRGAGSSEIGEQVT